MRSRTHSASSPEGTEPRPSLIKIISPSQAPLIAAALASDPAGLAVPALTVAVETSPAVSADYSSVLIRAVDEHTHHERQQVTAKFVYPSPTGWIASECKGSLAAVKRCGMGLFSRRAQLRNPR
jgi:hypothetical protein